MDNRPINIKEYVNIEVCANLRREINALKDEIYELNIELEKEWAKQGYYVTECYNCNKTVPVDGVRAVACTSGKCYKYYCKNCANMKNVNKFSWLCKLCLVEKNNR